MDYLKYSGFLFAGGVLIGVVAAAYFYPKKPSHNNKNTSYDEDDEHLPPIEEEIEKLVKKIDEQSEEPVTECPICFDERKLIHLHPCQHDICPGCLLRMKKTSIDSREQLQFACPCVVRFLRRLVSNGEDHRNDSPSFHQVHNSTEKRFMVTRGHHLLPNYSEPNFNEKPNKIKTTQCHKVINCQMTLPCTSSRS